MRVERLVYFPARPELGHSFRVNRYGLAGTGILPDAGATLPSRKYSKAPELNATAAGERIGDGFENGVDGGFGVAMIEAGMRPRDAFYEFRFDHREPTVQSFAHQRPAP
jgi:hypothetical protein